MAPKKNNSDGPSFTSFRIIGEKAQRLLAKAKEGIRKMDENGNGRSPVVDEMHDAEVLVDISLSSVVRATFAILAIGIGAVMVYFLQDKIVLIFLAMFLAAIMEPGVKYMQKFGIPRGIGIFIYYLAFLALVFFLLLSLIPILANQLVELSGFISKNVDTFLANPQVSLPLIPPEANAQLSSMLATTLQNMSINRFTDALRQFGQNLSSGGQGSLAIAAQIAGSVVNFFLNVLLVMVLAFFMQIEKEKISAWIRGFVPWGYRTYMEDKSEAITWKLGQWARGQLVLCFAIGALVFIALAILQMPYALTLALLAGFTEFIPYIGPLIGAVPAVIIACTQHGFLMGVIVAGIYYVIQLCENNLLVPLIMKRAVGLPATAIMLAMLIGVSFPTVLNPVLGIMLAIPATTVIAIFLEDLRHNRRQKLTKKALEAAPSK